MFTKKPSNPDYQATLWQIPGVHPLEMLKASYSSHAFPKHWHETYVIQVVEQGANEFCCEGKTWTACESSVVLINPFEVHNGHSVGQAPMKYRCFYPTPDHLQDVLSQIENPKEQKPFFPQSVIQDPNLASLILQAHYQAELGRDSIQVQSLLLRMLSQVILKHSHHRIALSASPMEKASVRSARDYIQDHFMENITLNQLAKISALSTFHFLRTFQKTYGLSPHEFLKNVRIERARELLKKGLSITEVAGQTGFYDQSHLNRNFKKILGLTPGQYRTA